MTDQTHDQGEALLIPKTVGERLRDARVAQRIDLSDLAERTRIPMRHLKAIEDGDYAGLPTPTYAVGFAKAYARAVGENEVEVARQVRGQAEAAVARRPEYQPYDTEEPARAPSRGVVLGAAVLAVLLLIGAALYFGTGLFRGDGSGDAATTTQAGFTPTENATPVPAATPAGGGQVTLVANDEVWLRVYDAVGKTLLIKTLAAGERYDVPVDADRPMINVGRPDKLQVLLNGSAVAPLGDGRVAIKDVEISAAALQARAAGTPAPTPSPSASATATTSASRPSTESTGSARSVPSAFRTPTPAPTRTQAAPVSTGQRDTPPAATTPAPAASPTTSPTPPAL